MAYLVNFTLGGKRDRAPIYVQIRVGDSSARVTWYGGDAKEGDSEPRSTIYRVLEQQVEVQHIRRGTRRRFVSADVE
jgi:hypothetical protein